MGVGLTLFLSNSKPFGFNFDAFLQIQEPPCLIQKLGSIPHTHHSLMLEKV